MNAFRSDFGEFGRVERRVRDGCLFGVLLTCALVLGGREKGEAADLEILTPKPNAIVVARNPQTHVVLRLFGDVKTPVTLRSGKSPEDLLPRATIEADGESYLHFTVRLEAGANRFTITPSGQKIEINYRPVRAALGPKLLSKDVYLFHGEDERRKVCSGCHDLGTTGTPGPRGETSIASCNECHHDIMEKRKWRHSPTRSGQCLFCHKSPEENGRLGFPKGYIGETCFGCHVTRAQWRSKKHMHGPLNTGGCTLCHDPHGEEYPHQLWAEGSLSLCVTCHGDKQVLATKATKGARVLYVHGPIPGVGCVVCHDPHATDNPVMLKKPVNELCVSCHLSFSEVERGHPIAEHPVKGRPERRRKDRELSCVSCHDPHGSKYRFLLIKDTKGDSICRECH